MASLPRQLPSIDKLLRRVPDLPRSLALSEARALVAQERAHSSGLGDFESSPQSWENALRTRVEEAQKPRLRKVINASGVVLHTNLGRAPMSKAVATQVAERAQGYCNLEMDLESGERGERLGPVQSRLASLCGAESAVVANNCAAAVLLMLTALASGREVVVSRGELVEIGGSFRVPEVIAAGGAILREVGTTNRTRVADYLAATGPQTAAWLIVHPSNFWMRGFVERPERSALAKAAKERGVLLLEDLGAGALVGGLGQPTVAEVMAEGVELACFSGDKLLGGPQAGLVVGRSELVQRLRRHPLYRALRVDRLVLTALEATLCEYQRGELPPAVQMIQADKAVLKQRVLAWKEALSEIPTEIREDEGQTGGGSAPGEGLPGWVLRIIGPANRLSSALRSGSPAVIGRIQDEAVQLDPRTVSTEEEPELLAALRAAWNRIGGQDASK